MSCILFLLFISRDHHKHRKQRNKKNKRCINSRRKGEFPPLCLCILLHNRYRVLGVVVYKTCSSTWSPYRQVRILYLILMIYSWASGSIISYISLFQQQNVLIRFCCCADWYAAAACPSRYQILLYKKSSISFTWSRGHETSATRKSCENWWYG